MKKPNPTTSLSESLDLLADTYNYNHWIYSLLRPYLGDDILEAGAGIGNLTRFFVNSRKLISIEPDKKYCDSLRDLSAVHSNITITECDIDGYAATTSSKPETMDSVVCVNVLEHILDHKCALESLAATIKPGGNILLYVPACKWAFGTIDKALSHHRRYSKKELRKLADDCGLTVTKSQYVNFIGAFGWWWCSRMLRQTHINRQNAIFIDRLVPYLSAMERLIPPVVGQSLFVVLEKKK